MGGGTNCLEQAAAWCQEWNTNVMERNASMLEDELRRAELRVRNLRHLFDAADEYGAEAMDLQRHLAKEEFVAQRSQTDLHRIRKLK